MKTDLLVKVERLKSILVSVSNGKVGDSLEYKRLRQEFLSLSDIKHLIPLFIRSCRDLNEFWGFIQPKLDSYQLRREYLTEQFHPLLTFLEQAASTPSDEAISTTIQTVDSVFIQEAWQKALARRATDPDGALTAARSLLETVCKHILDERSVPYEDGAELPKLYSLTANQLNLSPSQHTEQVFKQILGSCQSVVEGLGSLRNKHSDAHGKGKKGIKPAPRHAELAVNLAGTMATFLLQTFEARNQDA